MRIDAAGMLVVGVRATTLSGRTSHVAKTSVEGDGSLVVAVRVQPVVRANRMNAAAGIRRMPGYSHRVSVDRCCDFVIALGATRVRMSIGGR